MGKNEQEGTPPATLPALARDFEDVAEDNRAKYAELLDFAGSFNQSLFSEEHFVLAPCLTPKRTLRQALMHYDGKQHASAQARISKAETEATLVQLEGDLRILTKIEAKIKKAETKPESLPSYICEVKEQEIIRHREFNPAKVLAVYDADEWSDKANETGCQSHLLTELTAIIRLKEAERGTITRERFQQEKLLRDLLKELAWYDKKLPELEAAARASEMTAEEEERMYWKARNERFIECKQLEEATHIPHDYWEMMSYLPESDTDALIEFAKEGKMLLEAQGLTKGFRYKDRLKRRVAVLTGSPEAKLLAGQAESDRNKQGNILLGLLFRHEHAAQQKGACDPEGMLFQPRGYNMKAVYVYGHRTDHARNMVCEDAIESGADWVFFVDDDVILPKTALQLLLEAAKKHNLEVIGGEYSLKKEPYESASVCFREDGSTFPPVMNGKIALELKDEALDDEIVPVNKILATGCMLIKVDLLKRMGGGDWFQEIHRYIKPGVEEVINTDDYPFTQKCLEYGVTPMLHTGVQCQHVDMRKRLVYGSKTDGVPYCINKQANPFVRAGGVRSIPRVAIAVPKRCLKDEPLTDRAHLDRPKCFDFAEQNLTAVGMPCAEAFTSIVNAALEYGVNYLIFIETDMLVPRNALTHLLRRAHEETLDFVCGSYVRKDMSMESAAITVDEMGTPLQFPNPFDERGVVECGWVVPFGCSIIRTEVFADIPFPWFQTIFANSANPVTLEFQGQPTTIKETITHDGFFCERLFRSGYRGWIDTDLQCLHVDRQTGRVYGSPKYTDNFGLRADEAWRFATHEQTLSSLRVEGLSHV